MVDTFETRRQEAGRESRRKSSEEAVRLLNKLVNPDRPQPDTDPKTRARSSLLWDSVNPYREDEDTDTRTADSAINRQLEGDDELKTFRNEANNRENKTNREKARVVTENFGDDLNTRLNKGEGINIDLIDAGVNLDSLDQGMLEERRLVDLIKTRRGVDEFPDSWIRDRVRRRMEYSRPYVADKIYTRVVNEYGPNNEIRTPEELDEVLAIYVENGWLTTTDRDAIKTRLLSNLASEASIAYRSENLGEWGYFRKQIDHARDAAIREVRNNSNLSAEEKRILEFKIENQSMMAAAEVAKMYDGWALLGENINEASKKFALFSQNFRYVLPLLYIAILTSGGAAVGGQLGGVGGALLGGAVGGGVSIGLSAVTLRGIQEKKITIRKGLEGIYDKKLERIRDRKSLAHLVYAYELSNNANNYTDEEITMRLRNVNISPSLREKRLVGLDLLNELNKTGDLLNAA
ncbi:MAG TPA: hypothetical protein VGA67_02720 [Candidatus Dojkabacteria bacterium]